MDTTTCSPVFGLGEEKKRLIDTFFLMSVNFTYLWNMGTKTSDEEAVIALEVVDFCVFVSLQ